MIQTRVQVNDLCIYLAHSVHENDAKRVAILGELREALQGVGSLESILERVSKSFEIVVPSGESGSYKLQSIGDVSRCLRTISPEMGHVSESDYQLFLKVVLGDVCRLQIDSRYRSIIVAPMMGESAMSLYIIEVHVEKKEPTWKEWVLRRIPKAYVLKEVYWEFVVLF